MKFFNQESLQVTSWLHIKEKAAGYIKLNKVSFIENRPIRHIQRNVKDESFVLLEIKYAAVAKSTIL